MKQKYNYYFDGTPITRAAFLKGVPWNWEAEIEDGSYSYGLYRAYLLEDATPCESERNEQVTVTLYGQLKTFPNKDAAKDYLLLGMMNSEGAERERYTEAYTKLHITNLNYENRNKNQWR